MSTTHEDKQLGAEFTAFVVYLLFIFFNPQNLVPAIIPLRPALIITFVAFTIAILKGRTKGIMAFPQSKLLFLLFILSLAATITSINSSNSAEFCFLFFKAMLLYLLLVAVLHNEYKLKMVMWLMVIFMFINVATSLAFQKMYIIGYRLVSFNGEGGANDYALMILSIIPISLHFMERSDTKFKKGFAGLCTLTLLLGLTRTRSRMGFVGLVVLFLQIVWIKRKKPVTLLAATCLIAVALLNTHHGYFERIQGTDSEDAEYSRVNLWRQAGTLIELNPFLGVGPGNFVLAKAHFGIPGDPFHVAHNSFLELAAENGVLAATVYILIALVSLRQLAQVERTLSGKNPFFLGLAEAIRMAYVSLAVAMVFLSQQYNQFYFIFAALAPLLKNIANNANHELPPDREGIKVLP